MVLLGVLMLSTAGLTSCGVSDYLNAPLDHQQAQSAPPPPSGAAGTNATPAFYDPDAAAPPPPGSAERAPLPGTSGTGMMPNGLPALPAHGVDLQKQFSQDIRDPVARIKRVENAVVEMRRDFDAVYPAIQRLVAVEQDMQDLTRQLGTLLQNEPQSSAAGAGGAGGPERLLPPPDSTPPPAATVPVAPVAASPIPPPAQMPPPVAAAPAPVAAAPPVAKPAPAPTPAPVPVVTTPEPAPVPVAPKSAPAPTSAPKASGSTYSYSGAPAAQQPAAKAGQVHDFRVGEHPGTTRLVIDVSGTSYTAEVDNVEHLLTVDLPAATWGTAAQGKAPKSPFISSWSIAANGNGTKLIVQLKKPSQIVYQKKLADKIIIDLGKP